MTVVPGWASARKGGGAPTCGTVSAVGPALAKGGLLAGVAATSWCNAWAVGSDPAGSRTEPLIEHWNGRFWRQVPSPQPGAGRSEGGVLAAVTATSYRVAWGVGWSGNAALAERWSGVSWQLSPVLGAAGFRRSRLLAVAATPAGAAWAVGTYRAGAGRSGGLTARWERGVWRLAAAPVPAGATSVVLDAVTASASGVWAAGYARRRSGRTAVRTALVEHWDGANWRIVPLAVEGSGASAFTGVTSAAGAVWAAGYATVAGGRLTPLVLRRLDGRWRQVPAPSPAGARAGAVIDGVAAGPAVGEAWATGYWSRGVGEFRTLTERWTGKRWRIMAAQGAGALAAVSSAGGQVWAVGATADAAGAEPLALRWTGSWHRTAIPFGSLVTSGGPGKASALAASSGRPVEILGDRTAWAQVFAEPQGGFGAEESLVPQRVQEPDGSWEPVDTTLAVTGNGLVAPKATLAGLTLSGGGAGGRGARAGDVSGDSLLYSLTSGSETLSFYWPYGQLPVPVLNGPTAEYDGVLPGVNLLVTATATGVSDLIEVTSAQAAADPELASLSFPVIVSGLTVSVDASGNMTAADGNGNPVFTAAAPQMWDSEAAGSDNGGNGGVNGVPPANGPEPGDAQAVVPVTQGTDASGNNVVTLTPVASVLAGGSVVYPVFIDPNWNVTTADSASWSDVWEAEEYQGSVNKPSPSVQPVATWTGSDWQPSDPAGGIRSGVPCDNNNSGTCIANNGNQDGGAYSGDTVYRIYRSFLNFPVPSAMWGAAYADGELELEQTYAWSCTGTSYVTMWDTANNGSNTPSTSSTTWPGTGTSDWLSNSDYGYGYDPSNCPGQYISLPATKVAQDAANGNWPWLTVRLSANAADEASPNQWSWKRFDAGSMMLDLYWRNAPDAPASVGTQGTFSPVSGTLRTHCGSSGSPDYLSTNSPVWQAQFDDPDGVNGGNLDASFSWKNLTSGSTGTLAADQDATGQSPPALFTASRSGTPDDQYKWQVSAATQSVIDPVGNTVPALVGPASSWCYLVIDANAPLAPTVTSTDYASGQAVNPVGTQGSFTFTDPSNLDPGLGMNDVAGYYYGIDDSRPATYVQAQYEGGPVTVTITPFTSAEEDLYVAAVDEAGNVGPVYGPFRIDTTAAGNVATLGWWKLNGNATDFATVTGTSGASVSPATFGCPGSATGTPAGYSCSLELSGTDSATTEVPMAGNNGSFSVSAWVYPTACPGFCTAVSQDASQVSGFRLGYQKTGTAGNVTCPCWEFAMPQSDSDSASWSVAAAPVNSTVIGNWTQLTGVFNAAHGTLSLYVNGGDGVTGGDGNVDATASASPWSAPATGDFRIGADLGGSGPADYFDGSISDVCVFYGVLGTGSGGSSQDIQNLYDSGTGDGCSALYATYP